MSRLQMIRRTPPFQAFEDAIGVLVLFSLFFAGLALTGTA